MCTHSFILNKCSIYAKWGRIVWMQQTLMWPYLHHATRCKLLQTTSFLQSYEKVRHIRNSTFKIHNSISWLCSISGRIRNFSIAQRWWLELQNKLWNEKSPLHFDSLNSRISTFSTVAFKSIRICNPIITFDVIGK